MKALIFSFLLLLGACASTQPNVQSPQQRVYAAKADYLPVQTAAVRYNQLPRCSGPAIFQNSPCSKAEVVDALRKANTAAVATLDAAEQTVRTPGVTENAANLALAAATNAVDAVRAILRTYNVIR